MPFSASTLALVAQGNGQSVFHYRTTDSLSTVCAAGYFNSVATQFNVGDEIIVTRTGTNMAGVSLRVSAASATAVSVTSPPLQSHSLQIAVPAAANTDFSFVLPPCTIVRASTFTHTVFTGNTVTAQVGSTLGGVEIVAAVSIKATGAVAHTVVAAASRFAGGSVFVRIAQTTTFGALGGAVMTVEYVAD